MKMTLTFTVDVPDNVHFDLGIDEDELAHTVLSRVKVAVDDVVRRYDSTVTTNQASY